jgi:hypothetical protein
LSAVLRIRILAIINDYILTILVCVKAMNTAGICYKKTTFWLIKIPYLGQDPDPDVSKVVFGSGFYTKKRPDPQCWLSESMNFSFTVHYKD